MLGRGSLTSNIRWDTKCPYCSDFFTLEDVSYECVVGGYPPNTIKCKHCNKEFLLEAYEDVAKKQILEDMGFSQCNGKKPINFY